MEKLERDDNPETQEDKGPPLRAGNRNLWLMIVALSVLMVMLLVTRGPKTSTIEHYFFLEQLEAGNVAQVTHIPPYEVTGEFRDPPQAFTIEDGQRKLKEDSKGNPVKLKEKFYVYLDPDLSEKERDRLSALYEKHNVLFSTQPKADNSQLLFILVGVVFPLILVLFLWSMFRRTREQIMGGGFLSGFSKSPAKRYEGVLQPTTFQDVAGLDGVKADLQELIDFLKDPEKFQRLGGRVPKGVLLAGAPGTGKTLLARAVAGEAGVPFYTVNGSEFIQMFVGVGASRVRDLFAQAKANGPSIVFIDEIDAVGRQRGAGLGGGHDEREQTLNQILSEMDGFAQDDSVIVVAATNRPDVLDPALLRPGRFDRLITVDRPTKKGRMAIFKVHVRDIPLADDVDITRLAEGTVGLTGADIRNLANEAALWATRNDKDMVYMEDFEHARDKVLMGSKREEVLVGREKEKTAYHEAGHALIAWTVKGADRVHKVTVIPRGRALGVTQTLPEEDKMNITEGELNDRLAFLLGGRSAEKLIYGQYSAGAENDLEQATALARRMVTKWGMSEKLGPVSYKMADDDPFLGREMHQQRQFSEHTMQVIDEEVADILHRSSDRSIALLEQHGDKLDKLAAELVEQEELGEREIAALIGPSVHDDEDETAQGTGELAAKLDSRK